MIEVAIVRPGPIQGDMVHPYLRRRVGQEHVTYPHPSLERVLAKTLGVPIFQEQVMKLAVLAADYTPGEADQLRRDMAAWRKAGRIEAHRDRMVPRMIEKGIDADFAERVFAQIRGFGEYGFPESHAASFALLSYATAWMRCHHPSVFLCALLNAQPMGFYQPATLIEDAKRHGVRVLPLGVLESDWDCTLEGSISSPSSPPSSDSPTATDLGPPTYPAVRMGLRYVTGLSVLDREAIERARGEAPFTSLEDFALRTSLGARPLTKLAQAGAFDGFGIGRRDALWAVKKLARFRRDALAARGLAETRTQLHFADLGAAERVAWDYRASRHSTAGHPLAKLRPDLRRQRIPTAREIGALPDGRHVRYVGLVICRQRPGTASGVTFFTMEDETGFVNVVLWRQLFERQRTLAKTAMLLGIEGDLQVQEGVTHLIAKRLFAPRLLDPGVSDVRDGGGGGPEIEHPGSRDFH